MSSSEEPKRTILGTYMGINFVESVPYVPDYEAERARTDPQARADLIIGRFWPGETTMDGENTPNQPIQGPIEPPKGLTVGRNCHYVTSSGRHLAAIITDVTDRQAGIVSLIAFDPTIGYSPHKYGVAYDPLNHRPSTWHYIGPVID